MIKLIKENENGKLFDAGAYKIEQRYYEVKNGEYLLNVRKKKDSQYEYYPSIHCNITSYEFTIGTTGYGDLNTEDVQKVIEGYQEAVKTVKELEEKFLNN